ncbi:MAG: hypothetical protein JWP44_4800 [Mucilaginibacter sp.]|nr:hypothetical protein [Mucilaginibacter sp.]
MKLLSSAMLLATLVVPCVANAKVSAASPVLPMGGRVTAASPVLPMGGRITAASPVLPMGGRIV